jgi:hypothetical protein
MFFRKPKKSKKKNLWLWRVKPMTWRSTLLYLYRCTAHSVLSIYNMLLFYINIL